MNRVDTLRNSRESYAVKLRDFLRIASRRPNAYVIFFEGHDIKYYGHRIELLRPDVQWEGINSGGKDNVLKLYSVVTEHPQHKLLGTLYFIDRDYDSPDDLPIDPRVYITPCYSVENLYVSEQAFRRILRDEFNLNEHAEDDDSFGKCLAAFRQSFSAFIECTAMLNGWAMLQRRYEKDNSGAAKSNLQSIRLSKIIQVGLQTTTAAYTLSDIEKTTNATKSFTSEEAIAAVVDIPAELRLFCFRGKFQIHFLRLFIAKLCEDANLKSPELFSVSRHVPLNLSEDNIISQLCQHAETPPCLRNFIAAIPYPPPVRGGG